METFGPLNARRFEIISEVMSIPVKTGDIIYRHGDARGPLNLPFSRIVSWLTKSRFSHASMILMEGDNPFCVEVSDNGVSEVRLIDWLDLCITTDLQIVRLKDITDFGRAWAEHILREILANDPSYDYGFTDPDKFYCTESVNYVAEKIGHPICQPDTVKDILPKYAYYLFRFCNGFFRLVSGKAIPLDVPFYYVGNESRGMMSSPNTEVIYDIS